MPKKKKDKKKDDKKGKKKAEEEKDVEQKPYEAPDSRYLQSSGRSSADIVVVLCDLYVYSWLLQECARLFFAGWMN